MDEALHNIASLFGTSFDVIEPHLETALSSAADPERSLVYLERLLEKRDNSILADLVKNPRVIESLVTIFSGSHFLTEILLRNPQNINRLHHRKLLTQRKNAEQIHLEAAQVMRQAAEPERLDVLRRYHRGEIFRIGTCDLLTLYDLRTVTRQLSHLADGLVRVCLDLASLRTGISTEDFVVIALGKLGAEELNYSSDIDLLFIATHDPMDKLKLGEQLIDNVGSVTSEGFLYRVDMRLRPWGRDGFLVPIYKGYWQYIQKHA
ncbi:MAG: glutamine synthetase adenylyltransferase, partial [Chloroflexi bacterium]